MFTLATSGRRHRSVSQYKKFNKCGEQYRLGYSGDFPWKPSAAQVLGTAVHSVYEEWEQDDREWPMASRFIQTYRSEIAANEEVCPLDQWMTAPRVKDVANDIEIRAENGLMMCEQYQLHCEASEWEVYEHHTQCVGNEFPFSLDMGEFDLIGSIDVLLLWPSGNITIRDLKTGNREKSGFQLGIYGYALRKELGLNVQYGEYYYTKDGVAVTYDLARYTDAYVEDQIHKLDIAIEGQLFMANPGDACTFCDVKEYCREVGTKSVA